MTIRLSDAALGARDSIYHAPRLGDWMLLSVLIAILLGNGLYVWHQLGASSRAGRAVFFGLLLCCTLWAAAIYTFKLSVSIRVGPHGWCVVRGPWRTELAWSEVARLVERTRSTGQHTYRWVVALAYDGRTLQVREDMVADYGRFRLETYERYRQWSDHGGTWGTAAGGPFVARDAVASEVTWWLIGASACLLPGMYFLVLLPQVGPAGWALGVLGVLFALLALRALLRRQTYQIDARAIELRRPLRPAMRLRWQDVIRVERARHPVGGVINVAIGSGRVVLALAARGDSRAISFAWSPRVPEYLILRGGGHQVRVRLHRLAAPDELLAWVEFYERIARHGQERGHKTVSARPAAPSRPAAHAPDPLASHVPDPRATHGADPADPWGASQGTLRDPAEADLAGTHAGMQAAAHHAPTTPMPEPLPDRAADLATEEDAWLRATRAGARVSAPGAPPTRADTPSPASGGMAAPPPAWQPSIIPDAPQPSQAPPSAPSLPHEATVSSAPPVPAPPQAPYAATPLPPDAWDIPDEAPPDENAPTSSVGGLAAAFETWQADNASRPPLPRYGPATSSDDQVRH